jgi:hypothetical protein
MYHLKQHSLSDVQVAPPAQPLADGRPSRVATKAHTSPAASVDVVDEAGVENGVEDDNDVFSTTANRNDFASQVAETCGLDGSTSNRATPVSQQSTVWSQQ